jgi:hypothetical protein
VKVLQYYHRAYRFAVIESDGRLRVLSLVRGFRLAITQPLPSGWYARLGGKLVGLGLGPGGLTLWTDSERRRVTSDLTATLHDANEITVLSVAVRGSIVAQFEYPRPRLPFVARFDPTFDETREDIDFGCWLATTLASPERLAHLEQQWAS